jgi:hypothetical protein
MMGDLNLYTSSETAYQNLVSTPNTRARLNDPINRPGSWNTSAAFADVATQSPRLASLPDGGASGGLDSRFDFILVSDPILNGSKGIRYIPGSYTSFGNDGQHYNRALTDLPANTSVSAVMVQNLYNLSDHLPVVASFAFTPPHTLPNTVAGINSIDQEITVQNPFSNAVHLNLSPAIGGQRLVYQLVSIQGTTIQQGVLYPGTSTIEMTRDLATGLYFLQLKNELGESAIFKMTRL